MLSIITGANSGIGFETARALRRAGHDLILTVRSQQKAMETFKALEPEGSGRLEFVTMDLADLQSVKKAAESIRQLTPVVDRLINNAGYTPAKIEFTPTGYEKSFASNHLGHMALTLELIPVIGASRDPRIINVSSAAHFMGSLDRMFQKFDKKRSTLQAYCDGKLANVFFGRCLARAHGQQGILAFSLHPGVVRTQFAGNSAGLFKVALFLARPFMISAEKGAQTSIYLATAPREEVSRFNGGYFVKKAPFRTQQSDLTIDNDDVFWDNSHQALKESGFTGLE